MLRSVVGAMAANMILVQMSFRCAHLISVLDLDRHRYGPRHHRNHVPEETSKACDQASNGWEFRSSGCMWHRVVKLEVGVIDPHPVQDHADAPCQSDHGTFCATTAGELRAPYSQPCRTLAVHHNRGSLTQRTSKVNVARFGNPARDIALARLVMRGSEADPRTYPF